MVSAAHQYTNLMWHYQLVRIICATECNCSAVRLQLRCCC
jgi:hypothetical protein